VHGGCQRDKGEGDPNPRRATKKWWGHLKNLRSIRAGLSATAIKTPREVFAAVAVQASAVSPPEWLAVEVGNGDTHDVQLNRPTGQWPLAFARYAFDVAHAHAIHVCCLAVIPYFRQARSRARCDAGTRLRGLLILCCRDGLVVFTAGASTTVRFAITALRMRGLRAPC
jgi:hypothetical protein